MNYIIGLGNPEQDYEKTRHNIGRVIVRALAKKNKFPEFEFDKKIQALISEGVIGKEKVTLIMPETFMNKSGQAVAKIVNNQKKAEKMTVVYDDLDLILGNFKINFNRGDGGHKGLSSIIKSVKTKSFARLRVGISGSTPSGKIKKPKGEEKVVKHVLGKFSPKEETALKQVVKKAVLALESVVSDGYLKAMNHHNS